MLIPQLADVSGVWSKLKAADWTWALYALGASALTYLGATLTVTGAVSARIPFFSTLGTQLAGSFVNRIVPARVGGIATNVRYLQKQGIDLAVASSSVGLQQLSGLLVHVTLSIVFLLWAGRSGAEAFDFLPSGETVLIGLTVSWLSAGSCSSCRPAAACCASASRRSSVAPGRASARSCAGRSSWRSSSEGRCS